MGCVVNATPNPRAGLDGRGKTASTGIRSQDRPARIESLYKLRYPGPLHAHTHTHIHTHSRYIILSTSSSSSCVCKTFYVILAACIQNVILQTPNTSPTSSNFNVIQCRSLTIGFHCQKMPEAQRTQTNLYLLFI